MIHRKIAFVATAALLVAAAACENKPDSVEKKSEATTQTSQGTLQTTTESKKVGDTLEAKAESKLETPAGTYKAKAETFVGTVTAFTAAKKIEIVTGEKKDHSFALDEKDLVIVIDPKVVVGSRVKLIDETGDNKVHKITVTLER